MTNNQNSSSYKSDDSPILNQQTVAGHNGSTNVSMTEENKTAHSIILSKYTKALLKSWLNPPLNKMSSVVKISVSQTVSFAAFLYEKMRNAVEFREEHLIRRAAVERIMKRRMILNENGRNLAEKLSAAGDGNGCGCGLFLVAVWVTDLAVFGFLIC